MKTKRHHFSAYDLMIYILVGLVILNHSVYYYIESSKVFIQYAIAIYPVMVTIFFLHAQSWKIGRKELKPFLCTFLIGLVFYGINLSSGPAVISRYLIYIPCVTLILSIYEKKDKYRFFCIYSNLMLFIAFVSLFFWLFASVLGLIETYTVVPTEWGMTIGGYEKAGKSYYGLYFEMQQALGFLKGIFHWRNCGIFCEGPAYAFMLSLALLTEIILKDKRKIWRIMTLIAALMSTCSAMGILYIVLILMLKWLITGNISKNKMMIPIVIVVFCIVVYVVIQNKSNITSVSLRISDYLNAMKLFKKHPFRGYGIAYALEVTEFVGVTNSVSSILMQGGLFMLIYYLAPLILMIFLYLKSYRGYMGSRVEQGKAMAIGVWTVFAVMSTILTQTFILLSIVAFSYKEVMKRKEKEKCCC